MSAMPSTCRPNILLLLTDDQRFDTIRALGNDEIVTPAMDGLVREGVAFTHACIPGGTVGAVCMPSRAMLHTGRTLFHLRDAGASIPLEHRLLGEELAHRGYHTYGIGKWHNGPQAYARSFRDGAEIFFGGMDDHWNVPVCAYDPTGVYERLAPIVRDPWLTNKTELRRCDHVVPGKHSSELFADAAVRFLDSYRAEAPFFLSVAFMAPHDPRTMPRRYLEMYDPAAARLPASFLERHPFDNGALDIRDELLAARPRDATEIRRHIAEYYAMISHLDAEIGRILHALERSGRGEDTIVILAGDNGLALGKHGLMGKQSCYEHSVRVPLVLRGPGIARGERRDAFVYLLDLFPSLCDLADLQTPSSVEGQSFAPLLAAGARGSARDSLFFAYAELHRSVRDRRSKLIEYVVGGRRSTQLFDLVEDPEERTNVAGRPEHAATLRRLRRDLAAWSEAWGDRGTEWGKRFWSGIGAAEEGWT